MGAQPIIELFQAVHAKVGQIASVNVLTEKSVTHYLANSSWYYLTEALVIHTGQF